MKLTEIIWPWGRIAGLQREVKRWQDHCLSAYDKHDETLDKLMEARKQRGAMSVWKPVSTAPKDGRPLIAMARFRDATAGFPQFVSWSEGAWRRPGRCLDEPLVCWAWIPRESLPAWPVEGAAFANTLTDADVGFPECP